MSSRSPAQLVRLPRLQSAVRHGGSQQVPFHTHTATELVYTLDGDIRIDVNDAGLPGKKGVLFILPAHVPHNQWCAGPWRTDCILFFDGAHLLDDVPRVLELAGEPQIERWIEELCTLHETQSEGFETTADGFLFALLSRIGALEQQRRTAHALHPRLAQAVQFIHDHLAQTIDAESLASESCASYSHLSALFRETFGCGPLKYQQNLRLSAAQKLLLNPYIGLEEVSNRIGYEDTNYFVRIFKKTYGVPPGKWRKQKIHLK